MTKIKIHALPILVHGKRKLIFCRVCGQCQGLGLVLFSDLTLPMLEDIASNCSLRLEHIQALNISNMSVLMRLYNMCEHTWDPDKTWDVYYWEELLPPLFIYRQVHHQLLFCALHGNLGYMQTSYFAWGSHFVYHIPDELHWWWDSVVSRIRATKVWEYAHDTFILSVSTQQKK